MEENKKELTPKELEALEKKEKLKAEMLELGKKKGMLSYKEVVAAFSKIDVSPDEIEIFLDELEQNKIELTEEDMEKELEEMQEEEISKEELEDLSVPEGINIDDHVKMYLKEIGKVNLLTAEEETELAKKMSEGDEDVKNVLLRRICVLL